MISRKLFQSWTTKTPLWNYKNTSKFCLNKLRREAQIASLILQKILDGPSSRNIETGNLKIEYPMKHSLRQQIINLIDDYDSKNEDKTDKTEQNIHFQNINQDPKAQKQKLKNQQSQRKKKPKAIDNWQVNYPKCNIKDYFTIAGEVDEEIAHNQGFVNQYKNFQNKKNLLFCPTYLTTHQLWDQIYNGYRYQLITGQFGIGKSYSALLFKIMSDYIYKYRKIQYQKNYISKNSKNKELIQSQIVDYQIPKIIYLSIKQNDTKSDIQNRILKQCFELNPKQILDIRKKIIENQNRFLGGVQLKYIYQQKFMKQPFRLYLIFDQIEVIASQLRKRNRYYQILKSTQNPNLKQKIDQIIFKQFKINRKQMKQWVNGLFLNTLKEFIPQNFHRVFYLSSIDIEQNILQNMNLNLQHKHSPIEVKKLDYLNKIKTQPAILDFVDLIELNLLRYEQFMKYFQKQNIKQRKLKKQQQDKNFQNNQLQKIQQVYQSFQKFVKVFKEQLYQILKRQLNYMTPLFIYKAFQTKLSNLKFLNEFYQNKQKRAKIIQDIIKQIKITSKSQFEQYFGQLLFKNQNEKNMSLKWFILEKFQVQVYKRSQLIEQNEQKILIQKQKIKNNKYQSIEDNNSINFEQNKNSTQKQSKPTQQEIQVKKLENQIENLKKVSITISKQQKSLFKHLQKFLEDSVIKNIFKIHYQFSSQPIQIHSLIPFEYLKTLLNKKKQQKAQKIEYYSR